MDPYALPRGHEPADAEDIISRHRDKSYNNSTRLKAITIISLSNNYPSLIYMTSNYINEG